MIYLKQNICKLAKNIFVLKRTIKNQELDQIKFDFHLHKKITRSHVVKVVVIGHDSLDPLGQLISLA